MSRLTKAQKKELLEHGRFWAVHAGHWTLAIVFGAFTLSLIYALWGSNVVFSAALIGMY